MDRNDCFSGGLQGQHVFEQLVAQIGEQNVYDLVKDHGPQRGLKENQQEKNLRIIGEFIPPSKNMILMILSNSLWWRWNCRLGSICIGYLSNAIHGFC